MSSSSRPETVAFGASGRNGGFCEASLTHGLANGIRHFPDEIDRLEAEGLDNLRGLIEFTRTHGIDCDLEETGTITLADQPYQVDEFRAWRRRGGRATARRWCSWTATGSATRSPPRSGRPGLLPPARPRRPARPGEAVPGPRPRRERTRRPDPRADAGGPPGTRRRRRASCRWPTAASIRADQVVVATSAYSGWLRRLRPLFVPVYDYVLVSEPLTPDERAVGRLGRPPGPVRRQQPVPLLPADGRRPDPVGRLRRDPLLRQPGRAGARPPAGHVRQARGAVLPGIPATRGPALPVPLGRRHRHDDAVHGDLRPDDGRPADLRPRLHRARRRGEPLGGRRGPRPHPPPGEDRLSLRLVSSPPIPDPAGADALGGGQSRPARPGSCRPRRRAAVDPAADARRPRDRLRL